MIKMNVKNPFDPIIEELCSRYNLNPEQIRFDISIKGVESKETAIEILSNFNQHGLKGYNSLVESNHPVGSYFGCTSGHFTDISVRTVSLNES